MNAEADAINTLEGTSYHQGGWTVDDYLDNFQTLVSDVGYTDPRTLVVKFRRGLKLGIQNQIATMPYGRPANTDPDAWYRAARRINQARLANEAFQSVSRSTPSGDGDLRELDLETRVKTNEEKQVSEMSHSCALNK